MSRRFGPNTTSKTLWERARRFAKSCSKSKLSRRRIRRCYCMGKREPEKNWSRAPFTASAPGKNRTFVRLNCAAIPSGLVESELFGHEKGAFTGALMQKKGRFEIADQGTLFLDEIGDISLELQPKLLRALQEQEFERLGSAKTIQVDVRLIAATHRDLPSMMRNDQFREDLFYRLNVFPVEIPPLRDRREDIPLLVNFFVSRLSRKMQKRH